MKDALEARDWIITALADGKHEDICKSRYLADVLCALTRLQEVDKECTDWDKIDSENTARITDLEQQAEALAGALDRLSSVHEKKDTYQAAMPPAKEVLANWNAYRNVGKK